MEPLIVNISEADVRANNMPGDQSARWNAQRMAYQQIVGFCVVEPGCEAVTFWGFTDQHTWLSEEGESPLSFDGNYMKKPAYDGAMDGFAGLLPARGENLIQNADFPQSSDQWTSTTDELSVISSEDREGNAGCVAGEAAGVVQVGLPWASVRGPMAFSAQVRGAQSAVVNAQLLIEGSASAQQDLNIATRVVDGGSWNVLSGWIGVGSDDPSGSVSLLIDGSATTDQLCVTEVALQVLSVP